MTKLKYLCIVLMSVSLSTINAQEIKKTQDVGLWTGASLDVKLNKKFNLGFSQDIRFFESLTELDKYITNVGVDYKVNKYFKFGGDIRYYINKEKDKTISQNWRYSFDSHFKNKIGKRLKFKYRLRFQTVHQDLFGIVSQGSKSNIRSKASFDYKLNKRHEVFLGAELFKELVFYRKPYFNKVRFLIGDEMKTEVGDLNFKLGYERELNSDFPLNYFFCGVYYTFKIKHEK